jgi:hypothetical protein
MSKAKIAACMLLMLAAIDAASGQPIEQVKRAVWEYCQEHDIPAIMEMIQKVKEIAAA